MEAKAEDTLGCPLVSRKSNRNCGHSKVPKPTRNLQSSPKRWGTLLGFESLPLAQSTSEHLRVLKKAGLIRSSQDGPRIGYCINFDTLQKLKALISII